MKQSSPIIVVGAGIIGLTTARTLQERGHNVQIIAERLPPDTTSNLAAAIWYPYKADPEEKVMQWGKWTLERFVKEARDFDSGVSMVRGREYFRYLRRDPWWRECVKGFQRLDRKTLTEEFKDAFEFEVPVIEMSRYLERLVKRFLEAGGKFELRKLDSLSDVKADVIFNCTGLGAMALVNDQEMFPIRGQLLWVTPSPSHEFLMDGENVDGDTYIIPRSQDAVLGGYSDKGNWNLEEDPSLTQSILDRCTALNPHVSNSQITTVKVGLRPGRSRVRLEREQLSTGQWIIHNYGHGGSGVTLSWGCAEEAIHHLNLHYLR